MLTASNKDITESNRVYAAGYAAAVRGSGLRRGARSSQAGLTGCDDCVDARRNRRRYKYFQSVLEATEQTDRKEMSEYVRGRVCVP